MKNQLRIYTIKPGEMKDWIEEWSTRLVPLRKRYGFEVVGSWTIDGEDRFVWILEHKGPMPLCHLLYVSGIARPRMAEILFALRETPVLTVSDDEMFIKAGGMVQVFVENGKMRFRINPRAAKRARLQLSSRLLALAELVDAEPPQPVFAGPAPQAR